MNTVSAIIPVFRDADRAINAAKALIRCFAAPVSSLEVLVVDDGSSDDTIDRLKEQLPNSVRLIQLEHNVGRAGARNAGASEATGTFILFIDCDCLPADTKFVTAHLRQFEGDVVASTGPVVGTGSGFWHEQQVRSSARRASAHARGFSAAGSTANLVVRRDVFLRIGGFNEGYRGYGFEDRDLLIRLAALGPIAWADDAVVEHHDDLDLATVCRKMREAGAGGSRIFSMHHPEAYRALGYAAMDGKLHPARARLAKAGAPLLPFLIAAVSTVLEWRWIPFPVRSLAVRALSGASYLLGTTEAADVRGSLPKTCKG